MSVSVLIADDERLLGEALEAIPGTDLLEAVIAASRRSQSLS